MTAAQRTLFPALLSVPPLMVLAAAALIPTDQLYPNQGDLGLYLQKARDFASGGIPYRDFSFEYPPLAMVPMVVPLLAWPFDPVDLDRYKWLFAGQQALLLAGLGLVLARIVGHWGDAAATYRDGRDERDSRLNGLALRLIVVAAGALLAISFRFDLFPALLMTAALWFALDGRPGAAGVAVGLGFLAKLFPVAVLPALAIPWLVPFDRRGLLRLAGALGATVLLGLTPFVALAGSESTFQFLRYNADRGLQVESIGGGLTMLLGLATGVPVDMNFQFSAVNVEGGFAAAWLAMLPVLTLAGFGLVAWLGWRRVHAEGQAGAASSRTIVELATICLLMLLATSKVFSIQYTVWLVPLAALLAGTRFWLAAALIALTIPIHPLMYDQLVNQEALPILILNLRNALLIALLAWMLHDIALVTPSRDGRRAEGGAEDGRART